MSWRQQRISELDYGGTGLNRRLFEELRLAAPFDDFEKS